MDDIALVAAVSPEQVFLHSANMFVTAMLLLLALAAGVEVHSVQSSKKKPPAQ